MFAGLFGRGRSRGLTTSSRPSRRWGAAGLAGALVVGTSGLAAAVDPLSGPLTESSAIAVGEEGEATPVHPGVADHTHFTIGSSLPAPTTGGWSWVSDDDDDFAIDDIAPDGSITTRDVPWSGIVDFIYRVDAVTDNAFVYREIEYSGLNVSSTIVGWKAAGSGSATLLSSIADSMEPAQVSPDGHVVASYDDDGPYVAEVSRDLFSVTMTEWDDPLFSPNDPQPQLSTDGSMAAVVGRVLVEGEIRGEVWVKHITTASDDVRVQLPCDFGYCEYDVTLFSAGDDHDLVFVTEYDTELGASSSTRVAATHYVIDVGAESYRETAPASVASANGRYFVGSRAAGTDVELSVDEIEIFDSLGARTRTVQLTMPADYVATPVSMSDDGLTLRYTARRVCDGLCIVTAAYFGSVELEPVAEPTRGPAEDEILRLYRAVFGRIPDPGGFAFWMDRYRSGESLLSIAEAFALSPEFVDRFGANPTDQELVDGLYQNVLDRAGDPDGVAFWLGVRAHGATVGELLVAFANSDENIDRTETRSPLSVAEGRVLRLYRAMLNREPDAGGLGFWTGRYVGGLTLLGMAQEFTAQPEYIERYGSDPTNEELVSAVYRNVLGRDGDPGGVAFWLDQLDDGMTVPELFVAFADSPENVENTGTVE